MFRFDERRRGLLALRLSAVWLAVTISGCATMPPPRARLEPYAGGAMAPYQVNGVWYRPHEQRNYDQVGVATWYGAKYQHHHTADGEVFDMDRVSAAHPTLPIPCVVEVTNLENGRRLQVRVNDRGPFSGGRILDLSRQGAKALGFYEKGAARVRVRYVGPAATLDNRVMEDGTFESAALSHGAEGEGVAVSALP